MVKVWRKIWRLAGLAFPILYFFLPKSTVLWITGVVLAVFVVLELIRFSKSELNERVLKKLSFIMKDKEKKKISTTTLFLIAVFVTILLFQKEIAILAIFYSAFGDLFAEVIGLKYGKTKIFRKKSLEGSLACFISCAIIGSIFVYAFGLSWIVVLIGALAATLTELYITWIDDNLTIPIVAAVVMTLLSL